MTSMTHYCDVGRMSGIVRTTIGVLDYAEVFQDYKDSAILFSAIDCDWKCCREYGQSICQNQKMHGQREVILPFSRVLETICNSYTDAVIFGGLEPMLQADELVQCIEYLRQQGMSRPIIIYTGYYPHEINTDTLIRLANCHVIMKFGRYDPSYEPKFDDILGITLASGNQFSVQY